MDAVQPTLQPRVDTGHADAAVGAALAGDPGEGALCVSSDAPPRGRAAAHVAVGVGRGGRVALADVREARLSVDECLAAVTSAEVGGIALFVGTVRAHDHGRVVIELEYSAHPRARAEIERVATQVTAATGALAVAAVHRVGVLTVGDVAVVVAAGAAHRAEAFAACRQLIDSVKEVVPIWKRQVFEDGSAEWVGDS